MATRTIKNLSNGTKQEVLKSIRKIQGALDTLRTLLPGKTDAEIVTIAIQSGTNGSPVTSGRLDSEEVEAAFKSTPRFSTQDVIDRFGCRPQQAAAALAICRLRGRLGPALGKDSSGSSLWRFTR